MLLIAPAGASVRLGPDLTPMPDGGSSHSCQTGVYSPCSFINLRTTDAVTSPVAAPTDGVITIWSFRVSCCTEPQTQPRTMTLKTFQLGSRDGESGYGWVVPGTIGPSFVLEPGEQIEASAPVSLTARVPIKAGERIGIVADEPIAFSTYKVPAMTYTIVANTQEQAGQAYGQVFAGANAINAIVEPDADGDGYGDETQDCQPNDPSLHGTDCNPPPVSPPFVPPLISGKEGKCERDCGTSVIFPRPLNSFPGPRGDGGIYVPLQCSPTAVIPCGGVLYVELPGGKKPRVTLSKKAGKLLAKAKYSLKPGKKKTIKLDFSTKTEKFLALRRIRKVIVTAVPDQGQTTSTTQTLKYPKPTKKSGA